MTQSKFQLVGSLLRPANLLAYKNKIEHRDDIRYPFYDSFPGYHETEIAAIKKVIADEKANGIDILTDGEYSKSMWHLDFKFTWNWLYIFKHRIFKIIFQ